MLRTKQEQSNPRTKQVRVSPKDRGILICGNAVLAKAWQAASTQHTQARGDKGEGKEAPQSFGTLVLLLVTWKEVS